MGTVTLNSLFCSRGWFWVWYKFNTSQHFSSHSHDQEKRETRRKHTDATNHDGRFAFSYRKRQPVWVILPKNTELIFFALCPEFVNRYKGVILISERQKFRTPWRSLVKKKGFQGQTNESCLWERTEKCVWYKSDIATQEQSLSRTTSFPSIR